ncbi:hypothetical protein IAT38_000935 [Cryptococcus sp. DSM 104549]
MVYDETVNKRLGEALLREFSPSANVTPEIASLDAVRNIVAKHPVKDGAALSSRLATIFFLPAETAISAGMRHAVGTWEECARSGNEACDWCFVDAVSRTTWALIEFKMLSALTDRAVQQDSEDEGNAENAGIAREIGVPRAAELAAKVQELMTLCKGGEGLAVALVEDYAAIGEAMEKIRVVNGAGEVRQGHQHWARGVAQLFESISKYKVKRIALSCHESWIPVEVDAVDPRLLRVGDVVLRRGASGDLASGDLTPLQLVAALTTRLLYPPPPHHYRPVHAKRLPNQVAHITHQSRLLTQEWGSPKGMA